MRSTGRDDLGRFRPGIEACPDDFEQQFVAIARSHHASVKGLISMQRDKVVLPYAKLASTHPRRCIFFGTINPEAAGYLTDSTGNRRYWPVTVTKIDLEGIERLRDQLWAEAIERFRADERWWLEPDEEASAQEAQSEREEEDAWVEPLRLKILDRGMVGEITTNEAMSLLGIPHERKDRKAQMRAAAALKSLGYDQKVERVNGKPQRVWRLP